MNMIDVQDKLKGLSQQQLVAEMQSPSGVAPQFLVLSEITRRKRMQDSYQNQQQQPNTTIAEEAVASAGVPGGGLAAMARSMAPNSSMAQNTAAMPQPLPQEQATLGMYGGGIVRKMADGGDVPSFSRYPHEDDWLLDLLNPVENAKQMYRDYNEGDYPGAAINAASLIPWGKSVGLAGNAALMAAPSMYQYIHPDEEPRRPMRPNTMASGGYVQKMADGGIVVRNGRRYIQQPNGSLVDEATGAVYQTAGQDLGNFFSGLASLPQRAGQMLGGYSATLADQMNQGLTAQDRANQGESSFGMRSGPDTSYRYPEVPAYDMTAMLSQAGPEFERSGREPVDLDLTADLGPSPLDRQGNLLAPQDEVMRGRSGPMTGDMTPEIDYALLGAPELQNPALRMPSAGGAGLATALKESAAAGPGAGASGPQYTEDTLFDPITGVPITGGGVVGETTDPNATGSLMYDLILTDEARKQYNDTVAKVEASKRAASGTPAPAQTTAPSTVRPETVVTSADQGAAPAAQGSTASQESSASVTGRGSGAAVGGANVPTSYEQELRDAMARAEKRANQDKWLALAQVGMQLMASKEPTLGGALGEAGIAGLQAFRGSRDAYENERLGLSKSLYDLQQQQAAALAAQRAAATKATGGSYGIKDIMGIADQYDKAIKSMMVDDGLGGLAMPTDEESVARIAELKREKDKYIGMLIPQSTFDATAQ
jgi:hypothetical protein